jgi:predicted RNase H-like HicB family nuclease
VLENIKEAAELCLESMQEEGWSFPEEYTLNHIEVDEK